MKVLIVGATGLVGQYVGRALVAKGHRVWVLTRSLERARRELSFPFTGVVWDGRHIENVRALADLEAVVFLAGESVAEGRWTQEKKQRILDSRVLGLQEVLSQVAAHAPQVHSFISASAIGYYGNRGEDWCREDDTPGKGFLSEVCQRWESALFKPRIERIRRVALRVGLVLASEGGALPVMVEPLRYGPGAYFGSGEQWASWIHIEDLASLLVLALENQSLSGVYNAVAPGVVRHKDLMKQVGAQLGVHVLMAIPGPLLQIAFGEKSALFLESQRVSSEKLVELGFEFRYRELDQALANLLVPLREADKRLTFYTYIPRSRDQVFNFFCDEKNLETLTPDFLNFTVLGKSTHEMEQGTRIDYRLKLYGVPLRWCSEISLWHPSEAFVDEQIRGPYRKWYHEHRFSDLGEGTLMRDSVDIKLPYGWLGRLALSWKVLRDVRKIFAYRQQKIVELFSQNGGRRDSGE